MSFIRRSSPPPELSIGQELEARIVDIQRVQSPASSRFPQHNQIQFTLELDDGFRCNSWISYYDQPSDASNLGKLCDAFMRIARQTFSTVDDCLYGLKAYGRIFVICNGHREYQGKHYPKLKIVCDRLPGQQTNLSTPNETPRPSPETISLKNLTPEQVSILKQQLRDQGLLE
jgi:hypothetical protein